MDARAAQELILAGNGPGELTGWIAPVARAARALAAGLRLTLALLPSQFAGGREEEVVRGWALFDTILAPRTTLALALGVGRHPVAGRASLVHLGGDPWLSARLARRWGVPAVALAETTLIARRHRAFVRVLAVSPRVADELAALGVPREKLRVTGDPRAEAPGARAATGGGETAGPETAGPLVAFLPGSRDRFFAIMTPFFLDTAAAIAADVPAARFRVVVSAFLSPDVIAAVRGEGERRQPALPVQWADGSAPAPPPDLVITIPGTNTLELAYRHIPFAVVVPLQLVASAPLEGALEWVGRIPGVAGILKRAIARRHVARGGFTALPNQRAGQALVPEWIGDLPPAALAARAARLLQDRAARAAMRARLREAFPLQAGAAAAVAAEALALAASGARVG